MSAEGARRSQPNGDFSTPESDVLFRADGPSAALREVVLPALRETNEAWAGHGFQVYPKDETLTEAHDQPSGHPKILFRTRATLPEDLVASGLISHAQPGKTG